MSFVKNETTNIWETIKSAYSELDYSFDWSAPHSDEGSIIESTWIVDDGEGTPPTIDPIYTDISGFQTSAIVVGGTSGNSYIIRNRITLASGLKDERIFKLRIKDTSE